MTLNDGIPDAIITRDEHTRARGTVDRRQSELNELAGYRRKLLLNGNDRTIVMPERSRSTKKVHQMKMTIFKTRNVSMNIQRTWRYVKRNIIWQVVLFIETWKFSADANFSAYFVFYMSNNYIARCSARRHTTFITESINWVNKLRSWEVLNVFIDYICTRFPVKNKFSIKIDEILIFEWRKMEEMFACIDKIFIRNQNRITVILAPSVKDYSNGTLYWFIIANKYLLPPNKSYVGHENKTTAIR